MTDKEQIKCKYKFQDKEKFNGKPYCTCFNELCEDLSFVCDNNCQIYEDFKQLARKIQECEELKAYAQRQENQREEYYKEFLKKDKALEEIEEVCIKDTREFADGTAVRYNSLDDILDIINKAKGT